MPKVIIHSVIGCHENKNGTIQLIVIKGRYPTSPENFSLLKKR